MNHALKVIQEHEFDLVKLREVANSDKFNKITEAILKHYSNFASPDILGKLIYFHIYASDLDHYEIELVDDLRSLNPSTENVEEFLQYNNKDYFFVWEFEKDYKIKVCVATYLKSESPEYCRKVKVGTRMVEEGIYTLECAPPVEIDPSDLPSPTIKID